MVKRSTFLFFFQNRKSKVDDPVIISSLAFTPETKMSSDSLCPTILILPHPNLTNWFDLQNVSKRCIFKVRTQVRYGKRPTAKLKITAFLAAVTLSEKVLQQFLAYRRNWSLCRQWVSILIKLFVSCQYACAMIF